MRPCVIFLVSGYIYTAFKLQSLVTSYARDDGGSKSCHHGHHVPHASLFISLFFLSQPLFASVGQGLARIIESLTWFFFMSLLTHRLVLSCVNA